MNRWHVVSDEVGTVLSVWGAALEQDAIESALRIAGQCQCAVYVHSVVSERPRVGQTISRRGCVQVFYPRNEVC